MGGAQGAVQGFASLGQVVGVVLAGPLHQPGEAHFPFGFGMCNTSFLLIVMIVLKRRPAMQPQYRQP